jgi:hypothetical protein
LIRPHTEKIKPPRALWVPFQLGHPLGAPDNPQFQRKVLDAVFDLFKAKAGPLLKDFAEDEPENNEVTVLACPVRYNQGPNENVSGDPQQQAFRREVTAMRPWYDMAVNKRQRTTVGVSKIKLEEIPDFIYTFAKGEIPDNPRKEFTPAYMLKLAVEDLKSYYIEAVTAQPGQANVSAQLLQDWFWDETEAGKVLLSVKKACETSQDRMMNMIAAHFIVPGDVARRQGK